MKKAAPQSTPSADAGVVTAANPSSVDADDAVATKAAAATATTDVTPYQIWTSLPWAAEV